MADGACVWWCVLWRSGCLAVSRLAPAVSGGVWLGLGYAAGLICLACVGLQAVCVLGTSGCLAGVIVWWWWLASVLSVWLCLLAVVGLALVCRHVGCLSYPSGLCVPTKKKKKLHT
jgi:hypothetical protein